ncbi:MAG TPA: hypothetical protein VLE89_00815 [Chlamydiales bacterium]|nr:hypothetical protein [Chlamydiales bacterium]
MQTVISYCTNDFRFIDRCIEEARKFSDQIVIPVCDHFFDGMPENRMLLEHTYSRHPDCLFIEFAYLPDRLYSDYHPLDPKDKNWAIFWAATTRYVGLHYTEGEYLLFLDSDEIAEGEEMAAWLDTEEYLHYDAQRLAAYFYALRPNFRAKKVVNLPLLVKRDTLAPLTLLNDLERIGAYLVHPGPKREKVVGLDGLPLIHHYSWVRTREECLQKARTWGHKNEENWPDIIEKTFRGEQIFNLNLEFEETKPLFHVLDVKIPHSPVGKTTFSNVLKINHRDLFRKGIELL